MTSLSHDHVPPTDPRLYLPAPEGWSAMIKTDVEKGYCFNRNPGEDYFHLIMPGEIYVQNSQEQYCLRCAYRMGVVTHNRLSWQRGRET